MSLIVIKNHINENEKKIVQDIEKKHLFHAYKYCGIVKWEIEPVKDQRESRDEWERSDRY